MQQQVITKKPSMIIERSKSIPISKNLSTLKKESFSNNYSLKKNFFDPSKSSPPNEFMIKLHIRMNKNNYDNIISDN
jgi:hypothetical protein